MHSTENNHAKYKDLYCFLDSVAQEKKIEIDDTPNRMMEKIINLSNELEGQLKDEIENYVKSLNIR